MKQGYGVRRRGPQISIGKKNPSSRLGIEKGPELIGDP
jgi:hypothetical protein